MFWDWLNFCLNPPSSADKYADYKEDRETTVRIRNEAVDVDFEIGPVLGKGSFGLVKEGIHRQTRTTYALKFVFRSDLCKKDEELFFTEAGILSGLSHEHIVEMRDFYKWDLAYCLAMEHMEGGELCEDIIRRVFYSEACARRIILQVLQALAYLHRRGICHRDVKPENLLLRRRGEESVKLADFGLATVLSLPTYKVVEPVGSPGYAAPELLRVIPYDGKADVFSLGVISFVLLSGYLPFGGESIAETVKSTLDGNPSFDEVQWGAVSEGAKDFVHSLLTPDQNKRPTAESAISHPWMKVHGKTLLTRSLSDRRSGVPKPLLEEFQKSQRLRLKAAVGAVVAANRFHRLLTAGLGEDRRDGAVNLGNDQPEEMPMKDKSAQDEELPPVREGERLATYAEGVVAPLEKESSPPQHDEGERQKEDG